ncbi:tudor domain-containing protein 3 [Drosophila obscura]|uniref:tudor domain-containing protein 3 n=1 Tax=Drosophila obscura TaxID=7282 RepID=UPI001BB204E9|nr:tudor domain-containing protein 3 [Drosophila obscura]
MELARKLRESGWHLTDEGIKTLTAAVGEDTRKIIDEALNRDIRDIGGGALPVKREDAPISGRIVLQVQRVRNIAAPKCNEESKAAPRLLQLDLSDGQNCIQGLELESVPALNLNVAPGSKIYFKADKLQLMQGFLLLRPNELQLLGGRVDAMYEKWDLARTMLKYARSGRPLNGTSVPPPWVAFGKKFDSTADRNFRSHALGDKDKPARENDEFNAMRNEAIAVATKAGGKKVFGGGGQNIVDHNIKKILDKGFSEEEARSALHVTRNNLERALFNLKRRKESGGGPVEMDVRPGRSDRHGREGKRGASSKDEAEAAKPAANATLFDFLTTKLPATEAGTSNAATESSAVASTASSSVFKQYGPRFGESSMANKFSDRSRFENNVSSSFAANRGGYSGLGRGGARSRGGGRDERPPREDRPARDDRPRREERPPRDERQPRDRGGAFNDRGSGRNKPDPAPIKNSNRNGPENPPIKSNPEVKTEQEAPNPNAKDQAANRRGSERRGGGSVRVENGTGNNNRRRPQPAINSGAGAAKPEPKQQNNLGEDFNARLNKVTEDTANLKLSAPKRESQQRRQRGQGQPNRQPTEPPQTAQGSQPSQKSERAQQTQGQHQPHYNPFKQSIANYSQLPNGYTYDPSKIMGFQSKETNEFAMSLLKSQGTGASAPPAAPAGSKAVQEVLQVASQPSPPSPFAGINPQPRAVTPGAGPQQFGMLPGDGWMWQKGDLCMAKYWDDGRYYEAEITGVSEKTCVVFFMGYGNHEEVLKGDILPITDAQNRPLSNVHCAPPPPLQDHHQSQHQLQQQQQHSRYRSDRQAQQQQVYVPPHKREH